MRIKGRHLAVYTGDEHAQLSVNMSASKIPSAQPLTPVRSPMDDTEAKIVSDALAYPSTRINTAEQLQDVVNASSTLEKLKAIRDLHVKELPADAASDYIDFFCDYLVRLKRLRPDIKGNLYDIPEVRLLVTDRENAGRIPSSSGQESLTGCSKTLLC